MSDGSCRHQFSIPGEWRTGPAKILQQHFQPGIVTGYQYATGMVHVFVNGEQVLKDGEHTGATPGRAIRGPGWTGHQGESAQ